MWGYIEKVRINKLVVWKGRYVFVGRGGHYDLKELYRDVFKGVQQKSSAKKHTLKMIRGIRHVSTCYI